MRDYALGTTFDLKFNTRQFTTGAPFTLAGTPAVAAYADNDTTQLTAGITLTVDFDSITGLHNVRVVATLGNGYAAGSNYSLVIAAGTVDSVSVVGTVIGEFSLEAQSPLRPTVAGRTLDVTATGAAGIDWANIENPATAQNLSATNIDVDQVVASVTGAVGSVTGAVGSVTGSVGGNVVGTVGSVVGSVGSVVGSVGGNLVGDVLGDVVGSVGSVVGLNPALLDAAVSTRATPAQVNAEVLDVLTVDTFAEPTGVPPATTTLSNKLGRLHMALRNEVTVDANTGKKQFHDDAGNVEWEKDFTDAGNVYNESESNAP